MPAHINVSLVTYVLFFSFLILATLLLRRAATSARRPLIREIAISIKPRLITWWTMAFVLLLGLITSPMVSVVVFAVASLLLLREFITITKTDSSDYRVLVFSFFVVLPLQYYLIYINWYGLFCIFIPTYVFLLVPALIAVRGSKDDFFERTAKIQWSLMICVYCVSYVPALIRLAPVEQKGSLLLLFLILTIQIHDTVSQVIKAYYRIRPSRVPRVYQLYIVEGLIPLLAAGIVGWALSPLVPFTAFRAVWVAIVIGLFCKTAALCERSMLYDWGEKNQRIVVMHGAYISKLLPLCFAGPIYFHITRWFFAGPVAMSSFIPGNYLP